jgi:PIN domain nuclease of toxin-antitoxin system
LEGERDKRLRAEWVEAIVSPENSLHVSAVVAFELLRPPVAPENCHRRTDLGIDGAVRLRGGSLPADAWRLAARLPPIHRDPVDRRLIAHALMKGMTLLTADANIRHYPVPFA